MKKGGFSSGTAVFSPLKVGCVSRKRGCLLTLAYYAFPRLYEFGERRWNDILTGENRRTRRKTCPSATLSATKLTWIDPATNTGLRGERPATNYLSHGTAILHILQLSDKRKFSSTYFYMFIYVIYMFIWRSLACHCGDLSSGELFGGQNYSSAAVLPH
jgi:hypothetical protein